MRTRIIIFALLTFISIGASAQKRRAKAKPKTEVKVVDPQKEKEDALFAEMLPNTQKLTIIDSVVVDIAKVVEVIPLPKQYGQIVAYNSFFNTTKQPDSYISINGFGNKCFYTEMKADSTYRLYSRERLGEKWSEAKEVKGLGGNFTKMAFPFMAADGTTMYFAAASKDGLGGYDVYMTSYDHAEDSFLKAENMGLPFNSHADDLLYVEDDIDGLAWLATTRRQTEGKVCVYTIALSDERQTYDSYEIDDSTLRGYADISSIKNTWQSATEIKKLSERLTSLSQPTVNSSSKGNILFVIDDDNVCTSVNDFSTASTKKLYNTLVANKQKRDSAAESLAQMRKSYRTAATAKRQQLKSNILKKEQEIEQLNSEISKGEKQIRQEELAARKR